LSATSSGCRHPWLALADAEGLIPGLGVEAADPGVAGEAGVAEGDEVGVAEEVGWVRELGASSVHAEITTRSLAGSALPPTPLRSTK
jgi:hypothetical protein